MEHEHLCVDHGNTHLAALWYVRQVRALDAPPQGPHALRAHYLCGEAHSHLPLAAQSEWTLLVEADR